MQLRSRTGVQTRKERLPRWPVEIYGRSMKPWAASSGRRYRRGQFTNQPAHCRASHPLPLRLLYHSALFPLLCSTFSRHFFIRALRVIPLRSIDARVRRAARACGRLVLPEESRLTFYLIKHAGAETTRGYSRLKIRMAARELRLSRREEIDVRSADCETRISVL